VVEKGALPEFSGGYYAVAIKIEDQGAAMLGFFKEAATLLYGAE
jgi:hypothetical protein